MDDIPTNPQALVTVAYTFAALFALGASAMWMRLGNVRTKREREGGPITVRWLTEAATATGLAMGLTALAFLLSLFV